MATATVTGSNIIERVKEDLSDLFVRSGSTSVLIEYTDRIQQMILGQRRWNWMLSTPKRFITERGQTEYWIGATGSQSAGQVDTGLNLTDIREVVQGGVLNRSQHWPLWRTDEAPLVPGWQNYDTSYSEGTPRQYRNDVASPNLLQLYPAPDDGNDYEVKPQAPHATVSTSGALTARTYYIKVTFLDEDGLESASSNTAKQWIDDNEVVVVRAPQPAINEGSIGIRYTHYNVYASEVEGTETKQNTSIVAIGSNWTEPDTGLIDTGADAPTDSDITPIRGHVIEFRYYKTHSEITTTASVLLIPNEYRDVVVAGVNMLAAKYLRRLEEISFWNDVYQSGLRRMISDQNPWPGGKRFIKPNNVMHGATYWWMYP